MNDETGLTPEERRTLLEAAQRRRRMSEAKREETNQKKNVSPQEYLQRLAASNKKDLSVLGALKTEKNIKNSKDWADQVGATFAKAHAEIPQVLERVERMRTKQGLHKTSILFHGDKFGRGKTWAAYSYLNSLVQMGIVLPGQVYYGTESFTLSPIANSGFERRLEMPTLTRASNKVFFIDDVGQAYFFKKEHREEVWYALVDHVYTRRLTLVLTTNLRFAETGKDSLGEWMGGRAFDRLRTLVGDDGAILLTGVNRRDAIYQENEQKYRTQGNS
jgi:DNA replication protein DnaC